MKKFKIAGIHPAYFDLEKQGREFMMKAARPYLCLNVQIRDNLIVSIPFRSKLNHPHGFRTVDAGGLDYTKAIFVDQVYLVDLGKALEYQEYITVRNNVKKIEQEVLSFFDKYKELLLQTELTDEEQKILEYTTLQYFHEELQINDELIKDKAISKEQEELEMEGENG